MTNNTTETNSTNTADKYDITPYQSGYTELEKLSCTEYANLFGMSLRKMSRYMLRTIVREQEITDKSAWEIPWGETDVCRTAAETKTMRIYFMSNEGKMVWDGNLNDLEGKNWGDSTLIVLPDGRTMLVDVGMNGYGKYLVANLRSMGVKKLDLLVLTHPHDDHCYSLKDDENVIDCFDVGQVYYSGAVNAKWSDTTFIERKCEKKGIPVGTLSCGDKLDLGDVHVDVVSPLKDVIGKNCEGNDGVNEVSIVMRLKYKKRAVLMTGDTNYLQERRFVEEFPDLIKADVLKIQHHGACNSNTQAFVDAVQPKVCFCMAWKDIEPHIYNRYVKAGARVFMDIFDGYLRVVTDGESLSWETSRKRLPRVDDYYNLACRNLAYNVQTES